MRIALIIISTLAGALCVVLLIGAFLPRKHVATREIVLRRTPHEVYAIARNFASAPKWRSDVNAVEMLDAVEGRERFREDSTNGRITYQVLEDVPDSKFVTEIVDRDLGYFGSWTYEFLPAPEATRVRITEHGEVPNVFFRFVSRFAFGHTATMDAYLRSLARSFGEEVAPQ